MQIKSTVLSFFFDTHLLTFALKQFLQIEFALRYMIFIYFLNMHILNFKSIDATFAFFNIF